MTNILASIRKRLRRFNFGASAEAQPTILSGRIRVSDIDTRPAALTMLFPAESQALRDFTHLQYRDAGEVVDLGAWAGSSTLALAQGLAANPRIDVSRKRIHAYDIFIWEQWMSDIPWNSPLVENYQPGDSFLPLYELQIAEYAHLIETYAGDLNVMSEFARPIEYLFVDVMKSWELANSSLQKFFTKLIPGVSVVHHQDYNHYFTPWIHLLMYRFRDYFKVRQYVTETPSTIFDYIAEIPREQLLATYGFESFSNDEFEAAFEHSCRQSGRAAWPSIASARVMAFIHQGMWERAESEYARLCQNHSTKNYDVQQIGNILQTRTFR